MYTYKELETHIFSLDKHRNTFVYFSEKIKTLKKTVLYHLSNKSNVIVLIGKLPNAFSLV